MNNHVPNKHISLRPPSLVSTLKLNLLIRSRVISKIGIILGNKYGNFLTKPAVLIAKGHMNRDTSDFWPDCKAELYK